jgi:hypothetical protein
MRSLESVNGVSWCITLYGAPLYGDLHKAVVKELSMYEVTMVQTAYKGAWIGFKLKGSQAKKMKAYLTKFSYVDEYIWQMALSSIYQESILKEIVPILKKLNLEESTHYVVGIS